MSAEREPNSKERKILSTRQVGGLLMSTVALSATMLGAGCSAKSAESPKTNKPVAESVKTPEKEVTLSASEKQYSEYLKTLSPEQVEVRESLNPDALAQMSDAELSDAFTVRPEEVTIDGKIDPELYAEAYTARMQALTNSGISKYEYDKYGGIDKFGQDAIKETADRYCTITTKALLGYVGSTDGIVNALSRGTSTDTLMAGKLEPKPKERYSARITVVPDSLTSKVNGNGTVNIRFSVHISDNWDADSIRAQTGQVIEQMDSNAVWELSESVIYQNAVYPGPIK